MIPDSDRSTVGLFNGCFRLLEKTLTKHKWDKVCRKEINEK